MRMRESNEERWRHLAGGAVCSCKNRRRRRGPQRNKSCTPKSAIGRQDAERSRAGGASRAVAVNSIGAMLPVASIVVLSQLCGKLSRRAVMTFKVRVAWREGRVSVPGGACRGIPRVLYAVRRRTLLTEFSRGRTEPGRCPARKDGRCPCRGGDNHPGIGAANLILHPHDGGRRSGRRTERRRRGRPAYN
jgi:hypothetical protein